VRFMLVLRQSLLGRENYGVLKGIELAEGLKFGSELASM